MQQITEKRVAKEIEIIDCQKLLVFHINLENLIESIQCKAFVISPMGLNSGRDDMYLVVVVSQRLKQNVLKNGTIYCYKDMKDIWPSNRAF